MSAPKWQRINEERRQSPCGRAQYYASGTHWVCYIDGVFYDANRWRTLVSDVNERLKRKAK